MKTLYTEKEKYRYVNMLILVFFILFSLIALVKVHVNYKKILPVQCIIFGILECICFLIWYPAECRRKKAIQCGQIYEGRVNNIEIKPRKNTGLANTSHIYVIKIECKINGERMHFELGDYTENPFDYVRINSRCNVYVYKGKYYFERFELRDKSHGNSTEEKDELLDKAMMRKLDNKDISQFMKYPIDKLIDLPGDERLEPMMERFTLALVKSKKYIIIPPSLFNTPVPYMVVYVEVHMKSKKSYSQIDFDLNSKVQCFTQENPINDMYTDEEFIADMKKMVEKAILDVDGRILIEKIYVVLK